MYVQIKETGKQRKYLESFETFSFRTGLDGRIKLKEPYVLLCRWSLSCHRTQPPYSPSVGSWPVLPWVSATFQWPGPLTSFLWHVVCWAGRWRNSDDDSATSRVLGKAWLRCGSQPGAAEGQPGCRFWHLDPGWTAQYRLVFYKIKWTLIPFIGPMGVMWSNPMK